MLCSGAVYINVLFASSLFLNGCVQSFSFNLLMVQMSTESVLPQVCGLF